MGSELYIRFGEPRRYDAQKKFLRGALAELPSFARYFFPNEYWLKDVHSPSTWGYDVRIFVEEDHVLIEVTTGTRAFTEDVRGICEELSRSAGGALVDEDSGPFRWD